MDKQSTADKQNLKLVALDGEDVGALSTNLQDAVLKIGDLVFQPRAKRFLAVVNRFDWAHAAAIDGKAPGAFYQRRQAVLRFEKVEAARLHAIDRANPAGVLSLLAVTFEATAAPAGQVTLHFAGGGAVRLDVECIEAELRDLGPVFRTKNRPRHDEADGGSS